jgi:pimeloyl-ACP methyl ester carboxylesterase
MPASDRSSEEKAMGRYIDLDDVRTWYEERGDGDPVVLLHGGLTDSRDFTGNLTALAARFRVYLPERRAHGHTPDVEGSLSVEAMAGDTVAFLERVVSGPARLVGYSAGAFVALHVAADRPELVHRLVLISGAFSPDGMLLKPGADGNIPEPLLAAYAEVSPDGAEHFPVVVAKVARAAEEWAGLDPQVLTAVSCPCLVIAADDDIVAIEHTVELYQALPDAALAIVPNASHLLLHEHADELSALVGDFLSDRLVPPLMPLRRATPRSHPA